MADSTLVVIGHGMVGHHFLEVAAELQLHEQFRIVIIGEEQHPAYDRVHLSEYFAGASAEQLSLVSGDFFARTGIECRTGERVVSVDRARKTVETDGGISIAYDKLVFATGSYPFVPPIEGRDRDGCFVYRTLDDLDAIRAAAATGKVGTVVGGGLLGLEAAKALTDLALETHVVEFAPRLMAVQLDQGGGAMLRRKIEDLGVRVHTSKNTKSIGAGGTCRHTMHFQDEESLETDLVVFSAGIRPRDELARATGLKLGERGGIVVDNQCRTSDSSVFAIGECALWNGQIFGLVGPGYQMARAAAAALAAEEGAFTGADMSTKLKLLGVAVGSIGDAHARTPRARVYAYTDELSEVYRKLVVSADGTRLLGAVLVGNTDIYDTLLQYCLNGIELPEHPEHLILPQREGSNAPLLGVGALPDTAQVCSCHNVSKGALCKAIGGGALEVGALKAETRAGTGCGGCAVMVRQILDSELEQRGLEVNRDLCEHFPHTRQALYHMVRVEGHRTFQDLLAQHGRGRGCDICKPAVASILASCWNGYVLDDAQAPLQDTNDHFLANLQKDGTYSVVPRIPGGEITPDKLIVIGRVAKRFGLYTKITGGQRIDLFGARVEQLPQIWRELVDAGLESGHAYAKAVRTVKSCVGNTWCRYGVQDSVALAIEVENRYKGLRAPHKLKFAVSGCTRECAEAQSKDVGIIATDKGWNLYVCGNGGMKPRHAELLAADLDRETLIRYVDRFLMFYIRTADRLQRTSVWRDNLEGGIDYLRQVVCEDELGIGDQLEAEMAYVVDTYECEWKRTLSDPEKVRRFRHFINSEASDDNVVFVREREQIRPARLEEKPVTFRRAV